MMGRNRNFLNQQEFILGNPAKMMSPEDRRVLEMFASRVRRRCPDARIWGFGSRVRGTADWDSDFDVCVVLDHLQSHIDRWIRAVAWEVGFDCERVITTVVFDREQFENGPMSESTLVARILAEGQAA